LQTLGISNSPPGNTGITQETGLFLFPYCALSIGKDYIRVYFPGDKAGPCCTMFLRENQNKSHNPSGTENKNKRQQATDSNKFVEDENRMREWRMA
jgi:hypothetical protein